MKKLVSSLPHHSINVPDTSLEESHQLETLIHNISLIPGSIPEKPMPIPCIFSETKTEARR
jgi:hypothetical protein